MPQLLSINHVKVSKKKKKKTRTSYVLQELRYHLLLCPAVTLFITQTTLFSLIYVFCDIHLFTVYMYVCQTLCVLV